MKKDKKPSEIRDGVPLSYVADNFPQLGGTNQRVNLADNDLPQQISQTEAEKKIGKVIKAYNDQNSVGKKT